MNKWTNETILQFIKELSLRRELWDVKSIDYRDRFAKKKSWVAIAVKFGVKTDEAHKKFKSLRTYARNEHKKKRKTGAGNREVTWFAYEAISFLFAGDTQDAGAERIDVTENFEEIVPKIEIVDGDEVEFLETFNCAEPSQTSIRKTKKKMKVDDATLEKNVKRTSHVKKRKNVLSSFVEHIAAKMKTYDSYTRAEAEFKISKILYEADMRMLRPDVSHLDVTSPNLSRAPHTTEPNDDTSLSFNSNLSDSSDDLSL